MSVYTYIQISLSYRSVFSSFPRRPTAEPQKIKINYDVIIKRYIHTPKTAPIRLSVLFSANHISQTANCTVTRHSALTSPQLSTSTSNFTC